MEYAQLEPTRPAPITATLPDLPNTAVQPPIRLIFSVTNAFYVKYSPLFYAGMYFYVT